MFYKKVTVLILIGQKLVPQIKKIIKMDPRCGSWMAGTRLHTPGRGQEGGKGGGRSLPWGSEVWKFRTSEGRRDGGTEEESTHSTRGSADL